MFTLLSLLHKLLFQEVIRAAQLSNDIDMRSCSTHASYIVLYHTISTQMAPSIDNPLMQRPFVQVYPKGHQPDSKSKEGPQENVKGAKVEDHGTPICDWSTSLPTAFFCVSARSTLRASTGRTGALGHHMDPFSPNKASPRKNIQSAKPQDPIRGHPE